LINRNGTIAMERIAGETGATSVRWLTRYPEALRDASLEGCTASLSSGPSPFETVGDGFSG